MFWPTVGRRKIGNTAGLCHGGFGSEGIKIKAASNSKQAFAMNPVGGRGGGGCVTEKSWEIISPPTSS